MQVDDGLRSESARVARARRGRRAAVCWMAAFLLVSVPTARAALVWRDEDLSALGIRKGAGLPLFYLYLDGLHSSFATQELSKDTPPWTLFAGSYNQYYYSGSLRDDRGRDVPGRFHVSTYLLVERLILLTPLRTERVQHYVELVPTLLATNFAAGSAAASTAGPGDLGVGTGFNFPEIHSSDALKVEALLGLDVFLPTAHYQPGGLRNLGFDTYGYLLSTDAIFHLRKLGNGVFFESSTYFAGTSKNDRFRNPLTGELTRYQLAPTVQQFFKLVYHLNRAHTLNLGAEGFFDFQYRDDRMGGSRIRNSAERSLMLGPLGTAVFWGFLIDFSVLREFEALNRPQGTRFSAIVYHVF